MTSLKRILVIIFFPVSVFAQTGGDNTYDFLNLASSARIAALGGNLVPVKDNDLNLVFGNPALLSADMHQQLTFSGVGYFADVKYGYAAYAHDFGKKGTFSGAMHYVSYGDFDETDAAGEVLGNFSAAEYSLNISWAKQLTDTNFTVGATLKTIYSALGEYKSFGMAADLGANYYFADPLINISLVAKNFGRQFTYYRDDNAEPLPLEVEIGVSKKLDKAPFRFSLVWQHLEKFDIFWTDPGKSDEVDPITGEPVSEKIKFGDKLLRHVIFGTEILLSKNFHIRASYNLKRRNELGLENKMSTVGLSWGFGFRISKFHISYGRSTYHLAGGSNHFSLTASLGEFFTKKEVASP